MTGNTDPSNRISYEPITDEQKMRIGLIYTDLIGKAVIADKLANRAQPFWTFSFENPLDLLDTEGAVPEYMIIVPEGETGTTRLFRTLVKKSGAGTDIPKTEAYRVELLKNTQLVRQVNKAIVRTGHIDATIEDSRQDEAQLEEAYLTAAISGDITPAGESYMKIMTGELEAQWSLGECSSDEAAHFVSLLEGAQPSGLTLLDIASGQY